MTLSFGAIFGIALAGLLFIIAFAIYAQRRWPAPQVEQPPVRARAGESPRSLTEIAGGVLLFLWHVFWFAVVAIVGLAVLVWALRELGAL